MDFPQRIEEIARQARHCRFIVLTHGRTITGVKFIKTQDFRPYFRQAVLFCFVGFMNLIVDIAVYFTAYHWLHFNYLWAQAVSYPCGAINSYFLNRRLTFSERGKFNPREMVRFGLLNLGSIGASLLALYVSSHFFLLNVSVGKAIANGCALCLNFCGSKWWVFRYKPPVAFVALGEADACGPSESSVRKNI
jgi:putative flippase GtrA